jgi:branched-chain amino acid aminotransferase
MGGKIARLKSLHLPLNDLGVLRAYGIFDYLRTMHGVPVALDAHIARFQRSAKKIGLTIPVSKKELEHITHTLIKKNKFKETSIKFVLTGGASDDGVTLGKSPSFYILAGEAKNPPESYYTKGVHLETHEYQRLLPDIKTINYIVSVQRQKELKKRGILELLYVHKGKVLECSSSNIFIVKGKKVSTPKDDVLTGTTKEHIKQLARQKYVVAERDIRVAELWSADEVFLTASNKSVMPVVTIDGRKIGTGKVGPIAKELRALYDASLK